MEIWKQVFGRSVRMGPIYVILSLFMGIFVSSALNFGARFGGSISSGGSPADLGIVLGSLVVPMGAMAGLIITTPIYLLFVSDKNAGVLEYLLAVGMDQRDVFLGYLKASIALCLVAMTPVVIINSVFMSEGFQFAMVGSGLIIATGLADVALVTFLMTAFSSMQRRPTGMNSPLGISIGVLLLLPEFVLVAVLGPGIVWLELATAFALVVAMAFLMSSVDRLIGREKLLP